MQTPRPDYAKALRLLTLMATEQPRNGYLNRLLPAARQMKDVTLAGRLKDFQATDMNGRPVSAADLKAAPMAVVNVWASWSYESMDIQRRLKALQRKNGHRLKLLSCLLYTSPSPRDTR